ENALPDHRHRRHARPVSRRGLGSRARVEHQPLPDAPLRGGHRARDQGHEARHLRRAPSLPVRHAAVVTNRLTTPRGERGRVMGLEAVMFDQDGTLVDTLPVCYVAFRRALERAGAAPMTDGEIHAMFGPSEEGMFQRVLPDDWQRALPAYFEEYERLL